LAKQRWLERQCAGLLDIDYWHLVFTLPHELNALAQGNPALIYDLLFRAASETLLEFGRNPRWLGGDIGITMVLHTWGQKLDQHIHVHCVVTGGALSPDGQRWIPAQNGFLFPTAALSRVFRGKYLDFLAQAYQRGELRLAGSTTALLAPGAFRLLLAKLKPMTGWCTLNHLLPVPNRCSPTSGATPTAWPSPIIDWSASTAIRSVSAGATTPTATRAR
jgi:hypothetical protein